MGNGGNIDQVIRNGDSGAGNSSLYAILFRSCRQNTIPIEGKFWFSGGDNRNNRTKISFKLIKSMLLCLRGSRTVF